MKSTIAWACACCVLVAGLAAPRASAQSVVINEFRNGTNTVDAVELVVINSIVDLRGMLIKDFSGSGANDGGRTFAFSSDSLWAAVRAGTIIVLRDNNAAADTSATGADYNLDVGLLNATYFTPVLGSSFDIATEEIIMIKNAGSAAAGVSGSLHAFATAGANAANYGTIDIPKLKASSGNAAPEKSVEALNSTRTLNDFNGTDALGGSASGSIGTWNNTNNQTYILSLRGGGGGPLTNVYFVGSADSVSETSGLYVVTLRKTTTNGSVSGAIRLSGTASTSDYEVIGSTNFAINAPGTQTTFSISTFDDALVEGSETIIMTFTNLVGGGVANPSVFTLTIVDDDVPPVTAEGLLSYRFSLPPYLPVTTNSEHITVSAIALTSGTIETNVTTVSAGFPQPPFIEETTGWAATNQAEAKAFFFTITPDVDYAIAITAITFRARATAAGPSALGYTITDGSSNLATYAANAPNGTLVVVSQVVNGVVSQAVPLIVQIQGWSNTSRSTAGTGNFAIDDVVVFGTVRTLFEIPPIMDPITGKVTFVGNVVTLSVSATPTDGDPVTLFIDSGTNNMPGVQFGSTNNHGLLTWPNPSPIGFYTVQFRAEDKDGYNPTSYGNGTIMVTSTATSVDNVWINELHYENVGADVNEGVEIAGGAGINLSSYLIMLYDGNSGTVYSNRLLSGIIPNESNGFGAIWFPFSLIQHDTPDGLALVKDGVTVVEFLSYEDIFEAVEGPAAGLESTYMSASEGSSASGTNSTPVGYSLQECGTGSYVSNFTWSTWTTNSMGLLNRCQNVITVLSGDNDGDGMPDDWEVFYMGTTTNEAIGDFDLDGFLNIEEYVTLTDPNNSASYLHITAITNAAGPYVVVPSATGRQYRLISSPLLQGQSWTNVLAGPVAGTGGNVTLPTGTAATTNAVRVRVNLP